MSQIPEGEERKVEFLGGASIDGAPIAYVVALAAVTTALAFIPFSVVLAAGGSFPLSQGIFGLLGWILGPIAGALASGVGTLLGVFMAPHTAGVPPVTIWGAVVAAFSGGAMVIGQKRKNWWIGLTILFIVGYFVNVYRAIFVNGVRPMVMLLVTLSTISCILLYALPSRTWMARLIHSPNIGKVALGTFLGTWTVGGLMLAVQSPIVYWMYNWPEEVWVTFIPLGPVENLFRALTGMMIGTGVIAGLRAIGLVKPSEGIY